MSIRLECQNYGLAIHTSSPQLGLSLSNFIGNSRHQIWNLGRDLSTNFHKYLADFIQPQIWADLAFLAVAIGPGSFTSTRIGIVTARTLAQQLDIPLFGISTLAAVAWLEIEKRMSDQTSFDDVIALQMPAQRGQLFTAIYQLSPSSLGLIELFPDAVMTPEAWQETLASWENSYELIDISADTGLGESAASLLELAHLDWKQGKRPDWLEVLPFYGQHPV